MIKPKVFHLSVVADTPSTVNFGVGCSNFLVKNFGSDLLKVSFGDEIDESYILVFPKTAEPIYSTAVGTPEAETDQITLSSVGNCDVEIRLLEY